MHPLGAMRMTGLVLSYRMALMALLLPGCLQPGSAPDDIVVPRTGQPAIQGVILDCDLEAGRWRLDVETDAWSGGGGLAWTEDGVYLETHNNLRSIRAAPLGARDSLRADINIIDDFRPGGTGGNTVFSCRATPTAYVFVLDLDGEQSDCVVVGPDPSLLRDVEDLPLCTTVWEEEDPQD
jgi:hypothetical protein